MFNITGGELVLILVMALLVLGPERLPDAARKLGKAMAQLRDLSNSFQREIKDALEDPKPPPMKPDSRPQLTAIEGGASLPPEATLPVDGGEALAVSEPTAEVVVPDLVEAEPLAPETTVPEPIAETPSPNGSPNGSAGNGASAHGSASSAEERSA
jgi:sec-independent protein translocase protein TatB